MKSKINKGTPLKYTNGATILQKHIWKNQAIQIASIILAILLTIALIAGWIWVVKYKKFLVAVIISGLYAALVIVMIMQLAVKTVRLCKFSTVLLSQMDRAEHESCGAEQQSNAMPFCGQSYVYFKTQGVTFILPYGEIIWSYVLRETKKKDREKNFMFIYDAKGNQYEIANVSIELIRRFREKTPNAVYGYSEERWEKYMRSAEEFAKTEQSLR